MASGVEQLRAIGAELKALSKPEARGLRSELRAALKVATAPLIAEVRQSALDTLPHTGGLNEWVAKGNYTTSVVLSGRNVGIRIKGPNGHDVGVDAGSVRHPVFGTWRSGIASQPVQAGYFTRPLQASAPAVEAALLAVLDATQVRIMRL